MVHLSTETTTGLNMDAMTSQYKYLASELGIGTPTLQCPPGSCSEVASSSLVEEAGNFTASPTGCHDEVHSGLVAPLVMSFFGVLGNVLALVVLHNTTTERRRSAFYTLVAGLALTDLLGQLCTSPIAIAAYGTGLTFLTDDLCKLHGFLMVGFGLVTPLIVCLMALERIGALCCTYFCSRFLSKSRVRAALVASWVFAMAFAALPLLGFGRYELQFPCSWCFLKFHFNETDYLPPVAGAPAREAAVGTRSWEAPAVYACLYAVINLLIILTTLVSNIIVIIFLLMARKRRRLLTRRPGTYLHHQSYQHPSPEAAKRNGAHGEQEAQQPTKRGRHESQIAAQDLELQMVWLLCGMTLVFTCCWTPFMYQIIANVTSGSSRFSSADVLVVRIAAFNQILDPWVYIILRRSLFRKLRRAIAGVFRCRDSSGSGRGGCGGESTTKGRLRVISFGHHYNQQHRRREGEVEGKRGATRELLGSPDDARSPGLLLSVVHTQGALLHSAHAAHSVHNNEEPRSPARGLIALSRGAKSNVDSVGRLDEAQPRRTPSRHLSVTKRSKKTSVTDAGERQSLVTDHEMYEDVWVVSSHTSNQMDNIGDCNAPRGALKESTTPNGEQESDPGTSCTGTYVTGESCMLSVLDKADYLVSPTNER